MDADTLLKQIGMGVLMTCGARDFVIDGKQLLFRVGPKNKLAKVIVTLTPRDEYTVRYVEMSRKTYEVLVDETEDANDINVSAVVRRLGDR